jgi:hypothetical protein
MSNYYVDLNGSTAGPFSIAEITTLFSRGVIRPDTLYARPDSQEWLPISTILPLLQEQSLRVADQIYASAVATSPSSPRPAPAKLRAHRGDCVCERCWFIGPVKARVRGSFLIELVLWLCFLVPGIIYTLWRVTSRRDKRCPSCGSESLIPVDSRRGAQLVTIEPGVGESLFQGIGMLAGRGVRALRRKRQQPAPPTVVDMEPMR